MLGPRSTRILLPVLAIASTAVIATQPRARHRAPDKAGDKKRAELAAVRRVAVIPAFFGIAPSASGNGGRGRQEASVRPIRGSQPATDRDSLDAVEDATTLAKLQANADSVLPRRLEARTPFTILPAVGVTQTLLGLKLSTRALYTNNGMMRGARFPTPDAGTVRALAAAANADAVILCVMEPPRRISGAYNYNLGGAGYTSPHESCKAAFYVLRSDGSEVLHDYVETLHPTTQLARRDFLYADWTECQNEMIEDFLDELTRYTPPKKETATKRDAHG